MNGLANFISKPIGAITIVPIINPYKRVKISVREERITERKYITMAQFNGLGLHLGNISRLSAAKTRSISPENFTGEKGKGGMATSGTGEDRA